MLSDQDFHTSLKSQLIQAKRRAISDTLALSQEELAYTLMEQVNRLEIFLDYLSTSVTAQAARIELLAQELDALKAQRLSTPNEFSETTR